jgi:hypothetical protein
MNSLYAPTIIVSIMAAIGIAPSPLSILATGDAMPATTAARAAIMQDSGIAALNGRPLLFRNA